MTAEDVYSMPKVDVARVPVRSGSGSDKDAVYFEVGPRAPRERVHHPDVTHSVIPGHARQRVNPESRPRRRASFWIPGPPLRGVAE